MHYVSEVVGQRKREEEIEKNKGLHLERARKD